MEESAGGCPRCYGVPGALAAPAPAPVSGVPAWWDIPVLKDVPYATLAIGRAVVLHV